MVNGEKWLRTTRLAPSPTGALHLGNARTFLVNYLIARQGGWRIVCRMDDLDGPRVKAGADRQALEDLAWLGIEFDGEVVRQSERLEIYRESARKLLAEGIAYPCICTRSEVALSASAPHASDGASVYPGTCRGRFATLEAARLAIGGGGGGRDACVRFRMPGGEWRFVDGFRGEVVNRGEALGDFVIMKGDGTAAYQLASALDDAAMGVTDVVRGDDLVDSTPRQLALWRALTPGVREPGFCHLPLVVGPDGRRLAKRHGDTRISMYRERGVPAGRVLELLARWSGMEVEEGEIGSAGDLVGRFDLARMPREQVVFDAASGNL